MTCTKCGATIKKRIGYWRRCRKCYNEYHELYKRIRRGSDNGCKLHKDCFTCPFEDCIA